MVQSFGTMTSERRDEREVRKPEEERQIFERLNFNAAQKKHG